MKIDLHVHTSRHSACASMAPEEAVEAALENGLDGLVFTEHDYLWEKEELRQLQKQFPRISLFRGIEVSSEAGHVLVYGIESSTPFPPGIEIKPLVKQAHEQGALVALAHPCRYDDEIPDDIWSSGIDAVERRSANVCRYMEGAINRIQTTLDIPGICGSDAHSCRNVGAWATVLRRRILTENDLIAEILQGTSSCTCNRQRVLEINRELERKTAHAQSLIRQQIPARQIKANHGYSFSFQYGIANGKDMRLLLE